MSDLDLAALRAEAEWSRTLGRFEYPMGTAMTGKTLLALVDRIEAAERRLESASQMATKHGEVLQRVGSALGMSAGSDLHTELTPVLHGLVKDAKRYRWIRSPEVGDVAGDLVLRQHGGLLDRSIDAEMAQEQGK